MSVWNYSGRLVHVVCVVCVNNRKALILKCKEIHAFNFSFYPHFSEINLAEKKRTKPPPTLLLCKVTWQWGICSRRSVPGVCVPGLLLFKRQLFTCHSTNHGVPAQEAFKPQLNELWWATHKTATHLQTAFSSNNGRTKGRTNVISSAG